MNLRFDTIYYCLLYKNFNYLIKSINYCYCILAVSIKPSVLRLNTAHYLLFQVAYFTSGDLIMCCCRSCVLAWRSWHSWSTIFCIFNEPPILQLICFIYHYFAFIWSPQAGCSTHNSGSKNSWSPLRFCYGLWRYGKINFETKACNCLVFSQIIWSIFIIINYSGLLLFSASHRGISPFSIRLSVDNRS